MRDRQLEATLAFLRRHEVTFHEGVLGELTAVWSKNGYTYSISSRYATPDSLIVQIPEIKRRWEELERRDFIENSGTDRT